MVKFRVPHTLVLMFLMMIAALVLSWLIPAGEFNRSVNEIGQTVVEAGTYSELEEQPWLSPITLLTVVPQALADAQGVIFFVLLIGGTMGILRATGMLDALIGVLLRRWWRTSPRWVRATLITHNSTAAIRLSCSVLWRCWGFWCGASKYTVGT